MSLVVDHPAPGAGGLWLDRPERRNLTMRWVDATEALSIDLIHRVVSDSREAALALAREVAAADHDAVARLKSMIVRSGGFAAAVEDERAGNAEAWTGSVTGLQRNPR